MKYNLIFGSTTALFTHGAKDWSGDDIQTATRFILLLGRLLRFGDFAKL